MNDYSEFDQTQASPVEEAKAEADVMDVAYIVDDPQVVVKKKIARKRRGHRHSIATVPMTESQNESTVEVTAEEVDEFENWWKEFYHLYPRKRMPTLAKKAAKQLTDNQRLAALTALRAKLQEISSKDMKAIAYPASWLNKRMWEK